MCRGKYGAHVCFPTELDFGQLARNGRRGEGRQLAGGRDAAANPASCHATAARAVRTTRRSPRGGARSGADRRYAPRPGPPDGAGGPAGDGAGSVPAPGARPPRPPARPLVQLRRQPDPPARAGRRVPRVVPLVPACSASPRPWRGAGAPRSPPRASLVPPCAPVMPMPSTRAGDAGCACGCSSPSPGQHAPGPCPSAPRWLPPRATTRSRGAATRRSPRGRGPCSRSSGAGGRSGRWSWSLTAPTPRSTAARPASPGPIPSPGARAGGWTLPSPRRHHRAVQVNEAGHGARVRGGSRGPPAPPTRTRRGRR